MKKNGELLMEMIEAAIDVGEVPYQANRKAVEEFDLEEDKKAGLAALSEFEKGRRVLLRHLKELDHAAKNIASHAARFV